jgi:hypothetical protein
MRAHIVELLGILIAHRPAHLPRLSGIHFAAGSAVAESGRACDVHPGWRHAGAQPMPAVEASAASQARESL